MDPELNTPAGGRIAGIVHHHLIPENRKNNPPVRVADRVSYRWVGVRVPSVRARESGFRCPRGAG